MIFTQYPERSQPLFIMNDNGNIIFTRVLNDKTTDITLGYSQEERNKAYEPLIHHIGSGCTLLGTFWEMEDPKTGKIYYRRNDHPDWKLAAKHRDSKEISIKDLEPGDIINLKSSVYMMSGKEGHVKNDLIFMGTFANIIADYRPPFTVRREVVLKSKKTGNYALVKSLKNNIAEIVSFSSKDKSKEANMKKIQEDFDVFFKTKNYFPNIIFKYNKKEFIMDGFDVR